MKSRKVKACIAALEAARSRGDLRPEQEQALDYAISRLKKLSRMKKLRNIDIYNCVAEISEKLVNAFCKSKV
jgi:hypothetical protein